MTQVIKSKEIGRYLVELRAIDSGFQTLIAVNYTNDVFEDGYYQTLRTVETASEKNAKSAFYRYAKEAKNRALAD